MRWRLGRSGRTRATAQPFFFCLSLRFHGAECACFSLPAADEALLRHGLSLPFSAFHRGTARRGRSSELPAGALDRNGQQLDLRAKHSWTYKLADVSTVEAAEVTRPPTRPAAAAATAAAAAASPPPD